MQFHLHGPQYPPKMKPCLKDVGGLANPAFRVSKLLRYAVRHQCQLRRMRRLRVAPAAVRAVGCIGFIEV